MAVATRAPYRIDDSWRLAGCTERCHVYVVRLSGRTYPERLVSHDPGSHEAYGQAALSRGYAMLGDQIVRTGNLAIDGGSHEVHVDGRRVHLTPKETAFLFYLATRIGRACSHAEILRAAWGPEYGTTEPGRSLSSRHGDAHILRVNVARLRANLGTARRLIETIPWRGYLLRDEEPVGGAP